MKITTLLLFLFAACSLFAQDPVSNRMQIHQDQTAVEANKLQVQELEGKKLRLVEAISDGDLKSAEIMREEVLQLMNLQVEEGAHWMEQTTQIPASVTATIERMKAIQEKLTQMSFDSMGEDQAREAGNLVTEFEALMGRSPF